MIKRNYVLGLAAAVVFPLALGGPGVMLAQQDKADNKMEVSKKAHDEADRAQDAAKVMTEIMGISEDRIPDELMQRAKGIAVFPNVVKGAFGIGGQYGKGLVSQRMANGRWSAPSFVSIGGGSFGFQLGVSSTDLVLVFTNDEGLRSLLDGKVTLGADASVAAGPVGRKAVAGTDIKMNSAILSYSRSKGLFAGVSLDGAAVTIDKDANRRTYGHDVSGKEILLDGKVHSNAVVAPFMAALEKYSPATRTSQQ